MSDNATTVGRPDLLVIDHGTVVQFWPITADAQLWVDENVQLEDWQLLGANSFAVDWRYAGPLMEGMAEAGLRVDMNGTRE